MDVAEAVRFILEDQASDLLFVSPKQMEALHIKGRECFRGIGKWGHRKATLTPPPNFPRQLRGIDSEEGI